MTVMATSIDFIFLYIDGVVQDCSISISSALTMEILQSCTKASISFTQLTVFPMNLVTVCFECSGLIRGINIIIQTEEGFVLFYIKT